MTDNSVSIVVPSRNRQEMLATSLRLLQSQHVADLEILVVDDCSTDGTSRMVQGIGDSRVRLIRNSTQLGVAGARNRGLEAASGTWVAFCDDDDLWSPWKLERQLSVLSSQPSAEWCSVGAVTVDPHLRVRKVHRPPGEADVTARLLAGNVIPGGGSGVIARSALVRDAGGFDEKLNMFADWDLWIRLALRSEMASVARLLVLSVHHEANMSLEVSRSRDELAHLSQKYELERSSRGIPSDHARTLFWMAHADARSGHRLRAVRTCLSIARNRPSMVPLKRALYAVLGPRVIEIRDEYRSRHLPAPALRDAIALVEEVRALLNPTGALPERL